MDEPKNLERLASVETELKSIKEYLMKLDGKLDAWNQNYVPRAELNEMFRSRDKELNELKTEKSSNKALWPSWAAVAIATITAIISLWPK